jgi:hypothetical protein
MKRTSLILLVAGAILSSCGYDEDPTPLVNGAENSAKADAESQLRKKKDSKEVKWLAGKASKDWHVTTYFIGGVDYTFLFGECSLDNIQTFTVDGRYIETEGATKCDPDAPDIFDQGTYEFSDDYTHFILIADHLQVDFDVVELKPNSFKLKYLDPDFGEVEFWLVPVKKNWELL